MRDILFAIVGIVSFFAFCGVLIAFVPHIDLVIVVILVMVMLIFDFARELFRRKE